MRLCGILVLATALLCTGGVGAQTPAGEGPPEANASSTANPAASSGEGALPRSYPVVNGTLLVAPSLALPNGNLPWALDEVGGRQVLVPIHHATLTEDPGDPQTASMAGARSTNGIHRPSPIFFIHTSERTENSREPGRLVGRPLWMMLAAPMQGSSRVLRRPSPDVIRDSTGCIPSTICVSVDNLSDGWLRVVPTAPLTPGEYVLVPLSRPARPGVNVVYDFTLDPAAPVDKDAIAPGADLQPRGKKKR